MSDDTLRHDGGWSDRNGVAWRHSMLTDAEREAVERAQKLLDVDGYTETAAILRGLLERLGGRE